jgi:hypothetical protein
VNFNFSTEKRDNKCKKTQIKFNNSTDRSEIYLMTMCSVTYVPLKLWIIFNLLSFVSSNMSSQRFVLHNASSISTTASDVTEITSTSDIDCARKFTSNKLCHRASYDRLTKRCRIFNEQTSRNCDVGLYVIQTSVFLKKVDGKLCNFDIFPLMVSIYVC